MTDCIITEEEYYSLDKKGRENYYESTCVDDTFKICFRKNDRDCIFKYDNIEIENQKAEELRHEETEKHNLEQKALELKRAEEKLDQENIHILNKLQKRNDLRKENVIYQEDIDELEKSNKTEYELFKKIYSKNYTETTCDIKENGTTVSKRCLTLKTKTGGKKRKSRRKNTKKKTRRNRRKSVRRR